MPLVRKDKNPQNATALKKIANLTTVNNERKWYFELT